MKELVSRIERLEAASPHAWLRECERGFWDAVAAAEKWFQPEAASLSEGERVASLTIVEHMAWLQRFTGEADLEHVTSLYGYGVPTTAIGFILARAYVSGDESL